MLGSIYLDGKQMESHVEHVRLSPCVIGFFVTKISRHTKTFQLIAIMDKVGKKF